MISERPTDAEVEAVLSKVRERLGSDFNARDAIRAYSTLSMTVEYNVSTNTDDDDYDESYDRTDDSYDELQF